MPRFHFHILNGKYLYDDTGAELADIEAAKIEAVRAAGAVLSEGLSPDYWGGNSVGDGSQRQPRTSERTDLLYPDIVRHRRTFQMIATRSKALHVEFFAFLT